MENNGLIQDTGLFVGQKLFEFSLTESFESITNLFQTIKEYREFTSPDEAAWFEYIHQIFHIFGFNTVKVAQRLIVLQEMGVNQTPKALVCIIGPKEDFSQIIFGLDWESYLFYAAKFHQVEWVILTNGLQFKVLNFANDADKQKYFKCELDEIIKGGKTDSFFTLYKIFYLISQKNTNTISNQPIKGKNNTPTKKRVEDNTQTVITEFWSQLFLRANGKTQLFSKKGPITWKYLSLSTGKQGLHYYCVIASETGRVELCIERYDKKLNKKVFDELLINKSEIEATFGDSLVWDRMENNRASFIRYPLNGFDLNKKEKWPELQDQMIDAMVRFENAFRSFIQKID